MRLHECLQSSQPWQHHALLFLGRDLPDAGMSAVDFQLLCEHLAGFQIASSPENEEIFWEHAANHPDVVLVKRAQGNIKLEDIAPVRERSQLGPVLGKRRLFFIDDCERLLVPSANALLKVLEEPQAPCVFVLTARHLDRVLPTISSRCQKISVHFQTPQAAQIHAHGEAFSLLLAQQMEEADAQVLWDFLFSPGANKGTKSTAPAMQTATSTAFPRRSLAQMHILIGVSEKLAKKYDAGALRECLLALALHGHKNDRYDFATVRFVQADLRAWQNAIPFHPSAFLWLMKILMRLAPEK
jgi:DNA polymerase III subunit delta'